LNKVGSEKDVFGNTNPGLALLKAVESKEVEAVKLYANYYKGNSKVLDYAEVEGKTPLFFAIVLESKDMAEALLAAGCNPLDDIRKVRVHGYHSFILKCCLIDSAWNQNPSFDARFKKVLKK
jgi:hypothetical protein